MNYYNQPLPKSKRNKPKKKYYILNHIDTIEDSVLADLIFNYFDDYRIVDIIGYSRSFYQNGDININIRCRIHIDDHEFENLEIIDHKKFMFRIIKRQQNMTIECDEYSWRKTISNEEFRQYHLKHKLLEA